MISYIVGVPGAGKTYYAVDFIFKNYHKYDRIYTNIAGFKHDLIMNSFEYKHHDILPKLQKLYSLYKKNVAEDIILQNARELDLFNVLFVIDEAQNYFADQNPVLVWWLTYHRHLSQDILLVTQNLALIHTKYKPLAEKFIRAYPSSMRIFQNKFRYAEFIESRMSKASRSKVFTIKYDPEVFKLYTSGKAEKQPSVLLKYFGLSLFLFLIAFLIFYLVKTYFFGGGVKEEKKEPEPIERKESPKKLHDLSKLNQDYYLTKLLCQKNGCYIQNFFVPKEKLNLLLGKYYVIDHSSYHTLTIDLYTITIYTNSPLLRDTTFQEKKKETKGVLSLF